MRDSHYYSILLVHMVVRSILCRIHIRVASFLQAPFQTTYCRYNSNEIIHQFKLPPLKVGKIPGIPQTPPYSVLLQSPSSHISQPENQTEAAIRFVLCWVQLPHPFPAQSYTTTQIKSWDQPNLAKLIYSTMSPLKIGKSPYLPQILRSCVLTPSPLR